jgi:hypothetical protein
MSEMKLLAAALLVFGAGTAANAQETSAHADKGEYIPCGAARPLPGGCAWERPWA